MNRKACVLAVAAAFAAPAALAQSSVTIGGTVNIVWDNVKAGGNTGGDAAGGANQSLKSHDRVRDNNSYIRFSVVEDLGGGNSAFVQVESAMINNSDTRNNAAGAGASTSGWGNRNSGIGLRSKAAGRFLIGVWDIHYNEHNLVDPGYALGNHAWSTLSVTQNMGNGIAGASTSALVFGQRFSNTLRWDSPVWSGFSVTAAYARPTDAAPVNVPGDVLDGRKNRAWSFTPRYESGGLSVVYSYLQDKDVGMTAATMTMAGAGLTFNGVAAAATGGATAAWKITSSRLGARYKFANGLGIGLIWDEGKQSNTTAAAQNQMSVKRQVWALPLTFDSGNHHFVGTYARAGDWKGSIGGVNVGSVSVGAIGGQAANAMNFGADTGAKFWAIGYVYELSRRTSLSVGYAKTTNDGLVRYDMFTNGSNNTAVGADPQNFSLGMRHAF
jgi:predicted porin